MLALAGLKRLGVAHVGTPVPEDEMLPAVGQGAVCIECREDDARTRAGSPPSITRRPRPAWPPSTPCWSCSTVRAARRSPVMPFSTTDGALYLRGLIVKPDGSELIATERRGAAADAEALGRDAGHELKRRGGPGFLST